MLPDDAAPHTIVAPQRVGDDGRPVSSTSSSTKVAWTLRHGKTIVAVHDFAINPQGLTRVESSRASLFATKGGFYVDDFGPGPAQITLRQLVASGKWKSVKAFNATTNTFLFEELTAREDVQRFIKEIYVPATRPVNNGRLSVYFHDNHFEQGHDEHVFFPQNGLSISRAVDLPNVWQVEIQMVSLEPKPFGDVTVTANPSRASHSTYQVKKGDTLHKIAVKIAGGKKATANQVKQVLAKILKLNPKLKHTRTYHIGSTGFLGDHTVTVKPMHLAIGELLILPVASRSTPNAPFIIGGGPQNPSGQR